MARFTWDPTKVGALTPEQRKHICAHERMHLLYAQKNGRVSAEDAARISAQIDALERGEDSPEPHEGGGLCVLDFRTAWDKATDRAVNAVLVEDYVTNKK